MKIFLIGLPGSGKTTIGKLIADELAIPFIDLDEEIEATSAKSIREIFSNDGESVFRQLEADALQNTILNNVSFVLATGGGAPCFHNGITIMNQIGITIFLNPSLEIIADRLTNTEASKRPLFAADPIVMNTLKKLYTDRINVYQQAKIIVNDANVVMDSLINQIKK